MHTCVFSDSNCADVSSSHQSRKKPYRSKAVRGSVVFGSRVASVDQVTSEISIIRTQVHDATTHVYVQLGRCQASFSTFFQNTSSPQIPHESVESRGHVDLRAAPWHEVATPCERRLEQGTGWLQDGSYSS